MTTTHNTFRLFQLVYTDLTGPVSTPALGGFCYVRNSPTNKVSVRKEVFIKEKTDVVKTRKQVVQRVVIRQGLRIECLRTDRQGEYTSGWFETYCLDTGATLDFASTNTLQQNGVAKRDGRTIANVACCLLKDAGFPKSLWDAMLYSP